MNEQSHLQIIAKKMIHIKMIENFYKKKNICLQIPSIGKIYDIKLLCFI